MIDGLRQLGSNDVVVLHGCCHNPTGADLTQEQWLIVADVALERGFTPLIDIAYQGFGTHCAGIDCSVFVLEKFRIVSGSNRGSISDWCRENSSGFGVGAFVKHCACYLFNAARTRGCDRQHYLAHSRVNIAGVGRGNIDYLAESIAAVSSF